MKKHLLLIISFFLTALIALPGIFQQFDGNKSNLKQYKIFAKSKKHEKSEKFDIPFLFAEFHSLIRTREGEESPSYKPNYRLQELNKAIFVSRKHFKDSPQEKRDWIERGPGNVGGRTRAFIVDPYDETNQTWFAGSVSGGIWKTTDKGQNWRNLTPFLPNLATTTLAYSPANPEIFYAGTGEGFMNLDAVNGDGIFKSTDHGETWFQLQSSAGFRSINRIIVSPENPDIVLCCSNDMNISGVEAQRYFSARNSTIQKSTNGGLSWFVVYESGENRVQQIVADPDDFNIQYATINSIGIIKSTNAGLTWFDVSEGIGGAARIEMAIAPTNTQKLYLSVESGNKSDFYISENAGENWSFVNDTKKNNSWLSSQGWYDNCIAVHPYNEDVIYVGGVNIFKIEMQPGIDSVQKIIEIEKANIESYMTFFNAGLPYEGGGIGRGEDVWDEEILEDDEYTTVEIKFGSNRSQKAHRFIMTGINQYVYLDYVDVPFEVYDITNLRQIMTSFVDMNMNGQFDLLEGDYPEGITTHAIKYNSQPDDQIKNNEKYRVSYVLAPMLKEGTTWDPDNIPNSKIKIIWGSVYTKIRKTVVITDGYGQFGNPNNNSKVHVDHHNITMIETNPDDDEYMILNGNDGGVAYSSDEGETWTETDYNGYNTSQFYGCDKKPGADEYIGGTQDNGTWLTLAGEEAHYLSKYRAVIGGDGFEAVWHYKDPNKIIGSSQFNTIRRSIDGGGTWHNASTGITDGYGSGGPFVTKLAKSLSDPELLFAVGKSGVWRSENFGTFWKLIPVPDSLWRSGGYYSNAQVDISIANPQVVWAGINMSAKGRIQLSTDGGLTFNPVNNYDLVPMGRITGLETHPTDENTAYTLFSFAKAPKILKTTDLGQTWTDISGFDEDSVSKKGFPDVAIYSMVVMPYNTDIIWAGTEIGLFESTDGGESWHYADNGLPPVAIWQMKIVDDQVVAATHGRGIWSVTLSELEGYEPPDVTLAPVVIALGQSPTGKLAINANLRSVYDSTKVFAKMGSSNDYIETVKVDESQIGVSLMNINYNNEVEEVVSVYIISFKDGREYRTGSYSVTMYPLADEEIIYFNDFSSSSEGFGGSGFTIDSIPGFDSPALQSPHKYRNRRTIMDMLLTPIVVADTLATFKYDDIAIVEPGDSGSVYGQSRFFDYVVVEATKDGFNWIALAPGYDATYDLAWLAVYYGDSTLSQDMYLTHEIDLLNFFDKRDTILIRFSLFADDNSNGWGWAVDNIDLQRDGYLDVDDYISIPKTFYINRLYPNPVQEYSNIEFFISSGSNVSIRIYDSKGREVENLVEGYLHEGLHSVRWYPSNTGNGVYFVRMRVDGITDTRKIVIMR